MSVISLPTIHNTSETEAAGRRDVIMEKKICVYSFKKPNTFGKFVRLNGEVIKPCKYKFWALFLCFLLDFYSPADSLAGALGHTDP